MTTPRRPATDAPWRSLVPALAPLGGRRPWALVVAVLALTAWLALWPMVLTPGTALPAGDGDALSRWAVVLERGLDWQALVQVDRTNHPLGEDLVARYGVPLDAAPALVLVPLFGWPLGINLALWLWVFLAGLSAAWLGGRWWGDHRAALVIGVGWQTGTTLAVAASAGAYPVLLALALLPLALGLWLRALERGTWEAGVVAGLPVVALAVGPREALWWWVLAGLPVLALALMAGRLLPALQAVTGVVGAIAVVGLAPVAWSLGSGWLAVPPPDLPPLLAGPTGLLLAGLAAVGLLHAHRVPRRWVLPACWVAIGGLFALGTWGPGSPGALFEALPGSGSAGGMMGLAELGLVLLAGGLAAWRLDGAIVVALVLGAAGPMQSLSLTPWPPELPAGTGVVLELPLPRDGGSALVRAAVHGRPLASGAGPEDPVTRSLYRIAPVLAALGRLDAEGGHVPPRDELLQLRALGVQELHVDLSQAGPWVRDLQRRLGPGEQEGDWLRLPLP